MERRQHPRVILRAWAQCLAGKRSFLCAARDISLGGMLLEAHLHAPPAPGEPLAITLVGLSELPLACEVVRIADDGAFAVRYVDLPAASREDVQRIVDAAAESRLHRE